MVKRKLLRRVLVGLVMILACYGLWSRWDRHPPAGSSAGLKLAETRSVGRNVGKGNLLGIQPYLTPADYANEGRFRARLNSYLAAARAQGFIGRKTIVVFPEYTGSWLVCAGEKQSVYAAKTTNAAIRIVVASNLASFSWHYLSNHMPDRTQCALFRMKARCMARVYERTFSRLAKHYGVTVVAGSIILPSPEVRDGAVAIGDGPLYNACAVYGPDGQAQAPIVRKAFPTPDELRFINAGQVDDLPVFDTPAGRLGVLICADSWYPSAYHRLKQQGVQIIAVPCYLFPSGAWTRPWPGYQGAAAPPDVERADVRRISEGQAWSKYALPGRMAQTGATAGLNVFLRGRFWDLGADGQSTALLRDSRYACSRADGGALLNIWLD
jgi:predicted amidohydrolase